MSGMWGDEFRTIDLKTSVIPDAQEGRSGTQLTDLCGWVPALRFATAGMTA